MFRFILVTFIFSLFLLNHSTFAKEQIMPTFNTSKVFTTRGGAHSTTRGTIRLVHTHRGRWIVFHGGPNMYHFSSDGVHWTGQEITQFGSRNYLIRGDKIYSFSGIDTNPDPEKLEMVKATFQGTISGDVIEWGEPYMFPQLTVSYYEDLQQDSTGRFTVSGRVPHFGDDGKVKNTTIEWARSLRPDDITAWEPQQQVIKHISDMKSSEVHENIPLEDGKIYIIGMLSVKGQGRLYANLFDGEKWGAEDTLLAENMSTVRGTDKRMSAVWDSRAKVIHLSYVDHDSQLWYRTCKSPYHPEDWSEPVKLKPFKVFTNVMSLDTSKTPAHIYLLYGKTIYEHRDPRWQSGELYLMKFDGESWGESTLVSEPGTKYNWYPNMNEEISEGIGVLYLIGVPRDQKSVAGTDYDIMFASTGAPVTTSVSGPVDILTVEEVGHLTTRSHNRHLIYHPASGTWYAFVGTGKALVKEASGSNALFSSMDGKSWNLEHVFCRGYGTSSSQDAFLFGGKIYLLHWPNDWQRWDERYGGTPGEYPVEYRVRTYELPEASEKQLTHSDHTAIHCTNNRLHFYGSIARGADGYLHIGSRFGGKATEENTMAYITRSERPDDTSAWDEPVEIGRRVGNSVAPDLSALEDGWVIAINHYSPFSGGQGRATIAASLYDPKLGQYSPEYEVALGNTARRLRGVAEFDPGSKRLHLVHPDERGDIRHKILSAPYRADNWSPEAGEDVPGSLIVKGTDDDLTIALDYSRNPATITLVYRKEGTVYRKDYDGEKWLDNDTALMSVPKASAELSLNVDASERLGLLFLDTEQGRGRVIRFLELPRFQGRSQPKEERP